MFGFSLTTIITFVVTTYVLFVHTTPPRKYNAYFVFSTFPDINGHNPDFNRSCVNRTLGPEGYTSFRNGSALIKKHDLMLKESLYDIDNNTIICKPDNRDHHLATCQNITLGHEEYSLLADGNIFIKGYDIALNGSFYHLENNTATLCKPKNGYNDEHTLLLCVFTTVQVIVLSTLLIQACVLLNMKNLKDNAFCHFVAIGLVLLFLYLILMALLSDEITAKQIFWYTVPNMTHFYLLASFSWLSIMSTELYYILPRITPKGRLEITALPGLPTSPPQLMHFNVLSVGTTICLVVYASLIVDPSYVKSATDQFSCIVTHGPSLPLFAGPIASLFSFSILPTVFNYAVYARMKIVCYVGTDTKEFKRQLVPLRKNHMNFFKISTVLHITWIIGALGTIPALSWMYWVFCITHLIEVYILLYFCHNLVTDFRYNMKALIAFPRVFIKSIKYYNQNPMYII